MIIGLIVIPFLLISLAFNALGVISLYRFPDVYTRLHGATKCTTFGTLFAVAALLIYSAFRYLAGSGDRFLVLFIHSIIAAVVLLISNPTGGHALARAAHRSGILPEPSIVDALEADEKAEKDKREGGAAA